MAATPDGRGYWLVASDGGIFAFGDARFYGSTGDIALNKPVVGMAATPDGRGYWLVASDGGIFSLRRRPLLRLDRRHRPQQAGGGHGRHPRRPGLLAGGLRRRHLQLTATPASTGRPATSPSTSRWWAWPPPPTAGATGWWPPTAASSAFGDARFYGSTGNIALNKPVVGMATSLTGRGYWLVASDGGIFSYGDASFYGSTGDIVLNKPVVGMAAS